MSWLLSFNIWLRTCLTTKLKMFQDDWGRKFDNSSTLSLFDKHGTHFYKSCPNIQQQNGLLNKSIHILEMTCSFLIDASMPVYFRVKAATTAPTPLQTPYFRLTK